MKILNSKPHPKFVRTSELQHIKLKANIKQQMPQVIPFNLKFDSNVLNWNVTSTSKEDDHLQQFLLTNQKSKDMKEFINNNLSSDFKSLSKYLQYSPSVIFNSPSREQQKESNEMLLDNYEDHSIFTQKRQFSTNISNFKLNTSQKKTIDQERHELEPFCPAFTSAELETRKIPQNCLRISLISLQSQIFRVNYRTQSEGKSLFSKKQNLFKGQCQKLTNRLKRFFYKYPIKLFTFFNKVLINFQQTQLRNFLIQNSIKYNSAQISQMQQHLSIALFKIKPQCILQHLFLTSSTQEMIIVDFTTDRLKQKIYLFETNFWRALAEYFQWIDRQDIFHDYQIRKLQFFLSKLL